MINSVHKAMRILSVLAAGENKPITLAEIALKANVNKSTCSHIVSTLAADGFVERVSHSKGYILGPEAYCLTRYGKYDDSLINVCHPIMTWLYKKTGCAVVLAIIQNGKKFIIDYIDTNHDIFFTDFEIKNDDIYRTATGRVILANMYEEEIKKIYRKYGNPKHGEWEEVTSYSTLKEKLSEIGKKDIVTTRFEIENNTALTVGYAGAVFNNSRCIGAVGLALKKSKSEYEAFSEHEAVLKKILLKGITEINRRLSYS